MNFIFSKGNAGTSENKIKPPKYLEIGQADIK